MSPYPGLFGRLKQGVTLSQAIPVVKLATMATSNPDPLLEHEMFAEVRAVPGFSGFTGCMEG